MPPVAPRFTSAASSDQGSVRPNNEDRVYRDDARGVFLVVDGMGGHEAGEQAAEIAIERLRTRLERQTDSAEQRIREAITLANNAIYEAARQRPEWNGMACVLTAALVEDGQVTVGHVGDSRLYRIKRGRIEKVTHDHSPVGEREDTGELTETEAMRHPRRNEVYRDVGSEQHAPDDEDFIETLQFPFEPEGALLLCSDGLSDAIPSGRILKIIERSAGDARSSVRELIAAANKSGHDNVSVILIEGHEFANSFGRRSVRQRGEGDAASTESTDRMGGIHASRTAAWYRSGPAYTFYGALLGAAIALGVQMFLIRANSTPARHLLRVRAPETITEILEKSRPGDTVSVAPGTYAERVRLREGVDLISERPYGATIQGTVTADDLEHSRLEGFQIRGADIGIRIRDSDVILARDDVGGAHGPGVEFSGDSRGSIFGCIIHNNRGGGIIVSDASSPAIENNLLLNNGSEPETLRPGLLIRSVVRPTVIANVFAGNGAEALWLAAADEIIVQRNYFAGPDADRRPKFRILSPQEGRP